MNNYIAPLGEKKKKCKKFTKNLTFLFDKIMAKYFLLLLVTISSTVTISFKQFLC